MKIGESLEVRMGFEPTLGYKPKHAFQACALNHSATSPSQAEILLGAVVRPSRGAI